MCNGLPSATDAAYLDLADVGRAPRAFFFERAGVRYGALRWELLPAMMSHALGCSPSGDEDVAHDDGTGNDVCAPARAAYALDTEASPPSATAAPPVILLHGFSQSGQTWDEVALRLAATWPGRAIWALDFVGHGISDAPHDPAPYAFGELVATLSAFVDEVVLPDAAGGCADADEAGHRVDIVGDRGCGAAAGHVDAGAGLRSNDIGGPGRVALVGYSMGGRVALAYAAAHPDRVSALVLESAGLGPADEAARTAAAERDAALAARVRREPLADFMDFWETRPVFASQRGLGRAQRDRLRAARMDNDPEALALTFEGSGQHAMPNLAQAPAQLASRGISVLYLAGELDPKYAQVAESLRAADACGLDVQVLPGVGHDVHFECPTTFCRAVVPFLATARAEISERGMRS